MPGAKSIDGLESIVVGCADTIFLKDVAGIRELRGELTIPVYIEHDVQLAPLAAHVTDLDDGGMAQALLHLETIVVKIRSAEILVDGIRGEFRGGADAICIGREVEGGARRDVREDRGPSSLHRLPIIPRQRVVRDRVWPDRVILQTVGGVGRRPEIQERVDVDLIVENTEAPANDHVVLGLVRETQPRSKVVAVRRENVLDSIALDDQSLVGNEYSQIFVATVQRAEVFVTHSVINAQLLGPLPGILEVEIEGVYVHRALRTAHGNRRGRHVAGQVIGQREGVRGKSGIGEQTAASKGRRNSATSGCSIPRPTRAIKYKFAGAAAMIKLIHTAASELTAEPQLVRSHAVRHDVGDMPGQVTPAFRGR